MSTRILAIVPARGGSKGLPDKSTRPLAGLPLIAHSLRAAEMCPSVTRCIVTTDSARIAEVVREHGGDAPFLRSAELAADDTPMAPVLRDALARTEQEEGRPYDLVVLLDPTSPARVPSEVEDAIRQLDKKPQWDGVVSVSEPSFNPVWVGVRGAGEDGRMERYFPAGRGVTRRQDVPRYLRVNGNFYVWRAEFVRRLQDSWMDEGVHGMVEIPDIRGFAIDYADQLAHLQALVGAGLVTLPWLETQSG